MSAENVWSCVQAYRTNTAKELEKAFGTKAAIITALQKYPGKDLYHGHQSATAGAGTNQGADANLDAAISFLRKNKPPAPLDPSSNKPPIDHQKADKSKTHTENMLKKIRGSKIWNYRQSVE